MVTNNIINTSKPVGVVSGGTGSSSFNTYGPVVAGSTSTSPLTSISPSATVGIPFVSQGASANPHFGTAVVAGGGTGIVTTTAYGIIAGGTTATGSFQNVGTGTAGQVLVSGGAAALPSWTSTPAISGNLVLLSTQTASSSATINFSNLITSTYDVFVIEFYGVQPVTNAQQLGVQFGTGATPTWDSGNNYNLAGVGQIDTLTSIDSFRGTSLSYIPVSTNVVPNTSTDACSGTLRLYNLNSTSLYKYVLGLANSENNTFSGNSVQSFCGKWTTAVTAVSSIRFLFSSGNIFAGKFKLYGVAN